MQAQIREGEDVAEGNQGAGAGRNGGGVRGYAG